MQAITQSMACSSHDCLTCAEWAVLFQRHCFGGRRAGRMNRAQLAADNDCGSPVPSQRRRESIKGCYGCSRASRFCLPIDVVCGLSLHYRGWQQGSPPVSHWKSSSLAPAGTPQISWCLPASQQYYAYPMKPNETHLPIHTTYAMTSHFFFTIF